MLWKKRRSKWEHCRHPTWCQPGGSAVGGTSSNATSVLGTTGMSSSARTPSLRSPTFGLSIPVCPAQNVSLPCQRVREKGKSCVILQHAVHTHTLRACDARCTRSVGSPLITHFGLVGGPWCCAASRQEAMMEKRVRIDTRPSVPQHNHKGCRTTPNEEKRNRENGTSTIEFDNAAANGKTVCVQNDASMSTLCKILCIWIKCASEKPISRAFGSRLGRRTCARHAFGTWPGSHMEFYSRNLGERSGPGMTFMSWARRHAYGNRD